MYKLIFTETYLRREKKFLKQHPELIEKIQIGSHNERIDS